MMAKLGACMIVKDEEKSIGRCLIALKGNVDEIVIVDTGSSDRTMEIARESGAEIFSFEWKNRFDDARNFSFSKSRSDWILIIDADEVISEEDLKKIKKQVENTDKVGFYLTRRNYTDETGILGFVSSKGDRYKESELGKGFVVEEMLRLFKKDERVKAEGAVHENILFTLKKIGEIGKIDAVIHHKSERSPDKIRRYLEIAKDNLNPTDFFQLFQIGVQEHKLGNINDAERFLRMSLSINKDFALGWLELGIVYIKKREPYLAMAALNETIRLNEKNADAYNHRGIVFGMLGHYNEAVKEFKEALRLNEKNADYHYNLGLTLHNLNKDSEAEGELIRAIELNPSYKEKISIGNKELRKGLGV